MSALDGWIGRHRALVLAFWALLVLGTLPLALRQSERLSGGGFAVSGSDSQRVEALLQQGVPAAKRRTILGAVVAGNARATRADYARALDALQHAADETPDVAFDPQAHEAGLYLATHGRRHPVVVPLSTGVDEFSAPDVAKELRAKLGLEHDRRYGGVQLHLVGQGALWGGMVDLTKRDLAQAEKIGIPVVALILLAVFGSLIATVLPLVMGFVAVALTAAAIYALSTVTTMTFYVPNMASMVGLGVAIDYSLFIVVRYREERAAGADPEQARSAAMRTSGVAVLFSGAAVVIALAGLMLIDTAAIRSMAAGSTIVVLVAMAVSVSLLPILLSALGERLGSRGTAPPDGGGFFGRWADIVLRRPVLALGGALTVLCALALPVLGLHTGDGALRQFPADDETRVGFELALSQTSPGRGAPVKVLVAPGNVDPAVTLLRRDPEVQRTGVVARTHDRRFVLIVGTPVHDGDATQTKALVRRLRAGLPAGSLVGGNSAAQVDFNQAISNAMWKLTLWIAVMTFVLLLVMVRSGWLALLGVIANALSVAAAFGVMTAVFVFGWADWLIGDTIGYLDTVTIPLVLAVVFGLSMDYEVFLLTRIQERRAAGMDVREAVRGGVSASGATITGAASIMVAVFGCFALTGVPVIQEVGLGCAVAVAIDATLVRLVVVPTAVALLGDRVWTRRSAGPEPVPAHR